MGSKFLGGSKYLSELLPLVPEEVKRFVDWVACHECGPICDALREETGLEIGPNGGNGPVVATEVVDGAWHMHSTIEIDYINPSMASTADFVLRWVDGGLTDLEEDFHEHEDIIRGSAIVVRGLLSDREMKAILLTNPDLMCRYTYDSGPSLTFYWQLIGLYSAILRVEASDLTRVLLAHGLALAFIHFGADANGEPWDTNEFEWTSESIREGLALHYASRALERTGTSAGGTGNALKALLKALPQPYHAHGKWQLAKLPPEVIRKGMLLIRKKRRIYDEDFETALLDAMEELDRGGEG